MRMTKPRQKRLIPRVLLILAIFLLLVYLAENSPWIKRMRYPLVYEEHIRRYASEYEIDPFLAASVIWVESKFVPDAVSGKDARGLMQIIPSTGKWAAEKMGLSDYQENHLFEPEINIKIGCWYLSFLASQFPDNMELVIAAYNAGIGNVKKWLQNREYSSDGMHLDYIPFFETRNYVKEVLKAYEIYKEIYPSLKL